MRLFFFTALLLVSVQVDALIITIDFDGVPDIATRETGGSFWVGARA